MKKPTSFEDVSVKGEQVLYTEHEHTCTYIYMSGASLYASDTQLLNEWLCHALEQVWTTGLAM